MTVSASSHQYGSRLGEVKREELSGIDAEYGQAVGSLVVPDTDAAVG